METTTVKNKFFKNNKGEELTLQKIIDQKKNVNKVITRCLDEKKEVPADGFFKSLLGFKKEITYKICQEFFGEIKIEIIKEWVMIGTPLNDANFVTFINLFESTNEGVRKEYDCDPKKHIRLKFFFLPEKILEIDWE